MYAELSSECAELDPVLVVPWTAAPEEQSPGLGPAFVDLREDPYALDQIPEADQHPPLLQALRALNASRSPVFTVKCDAWPLDAEELEALQAELMVEAENAPHGFASYIDLVWRERTPFASFHQTEQLILRLIRLAEPLALPDAALSCVIRPAQIDLAAPQEGTPGDSHADTQKGGQAGYQEGFAVSLYVRTLGSTPLEAYQRWAEALAASVALLRGRELA